MFPRSIDPADAPVMAEVVGRFAYSTLGGEEAIRELTVRFFPAEDCAIVWVIPAVDGLAAQLEIVSAFAAVRECYAGEVDLELRFGVPSGEVGQVKEAKVFAGRN